MNSASLNTLLHVLRLRSQIAACVHNCDFCMFLQTLQQTLSFPVYRGEIALKSRTHVTGQRYEGEQRVVEGRVQYLNKTWENFSAITRRIVT